MKKWLLRGALVFGGFLLLLYGILMVRSSIPATVSDNDLKLEFVSLPKGSNAFDVLQEAGEHLWWPEDKDNQIWNLARNTNWDAAFADVFLTSNRTALLGWDKSVTMPGFQMPEVSPTNDFSGVLKYLAAWKKLARAAEVRQNWLFQSGQDSEAFEQILNLIQMGRRMQMAHGVLIDYLVGTAVTAVGLSQMQLWSKKARLSPDQLKEYIRRLEWKPEEEATAFANTIKAEYRYQAAVFDAACTGKMTDPVTGHYAYALRYSSWLPVFNLSQTKKLCALESTALAQAASLHYSEVNRGALESRPSLVSMFLSGNAIGQILHYMTRPAIAGALDKKFKSDVQLQATRTILALRAYQLTHGRLPENLAALVPEFLEAVPLDDFDGKPLRYSAERKIVYSVGKNLKDDGGDDRSSNVPESERHLDLVFKFEF